MALKYKQLNKIDYGIFAVIFVSVILFAVFNPLVESDPNMIDFFEILEPVEYGIVGILAVTYARRFNWKVEIFSKSYLALGLGYLVIVPGMAAYYYFELYHPQESHFVTLAGILFTLFNPFVIYHLAANCHYFKRNFNMIEKTSLFLFPVIVVFFYSYLIFEINGTMDAESLASFPDLLLNPVAIIFAIIGIKTFKNSFLGISWMFIAVGVLLIEIADFGYVYLELFDLYTRDHPIQNLFHISNMLIIYGLYKHFKTY